jgi:hypothetical protein
VNRTRRSILALVAAGLALAPGAVAADATAEVVRVLDALHRAAAEADEAAYFSLYAPEAVFLGTDAGERWTLSEFRDYAHPHFAAGRGWTYTLLDDRRHVTFAPDGTVAWFDEALHNEKYGECRGTGVLRLADGRWRIVQYNLTFPVPNAISGDVVQMIREHQESAPTEER